MTDEELLRYSRHILLDEIGILGQERLLASHAVIVGAGGLGSPAAMYLACSGVGHITLIDHDTVDLTNLQRQIAHTTERVGHAKVDSVALTLASMNALVRVTPLQRRADAALLNALLPGADVLLDCSDNFATRHVCNAASVKHATPLVSAAAIGFDGQIAVYDPRDLACPCYACMFAPTMIFEEVSCASMGVFAPLVGIIGAMQAAEALKLLVPTGAPLSGQLAMLDARTMGWEHIRVRRNLRCSVCAPRPHSGTD